MYDMRKKLFAGLSVALFAISTSIASAAPLSPVSSAGNIAKTSKNSNIIEARWRGHHWHHHGWHHRHRWHRHPRYGWGPGIGGFVAGAMIGSAIANSNARTNDSVAYCMQRFKSYDPASGTYLGYDGDRHPCP
jgi:hypothetical protein